MNKYLLSKTTLRIFGYLAFVLTLTVVLIFSAALLAKVVRAAPTPNISINSEPLVEQDRTPPMKCGVYTFMEQSLFASGYVRLGSGIVNDADDRWVLFQQIEGEPPLLWVILIYVSKPYQGLAPGSACEIMVGRAWVRDMLLNSP